jgi:hypothetical protein
MKHLTYIFGVKLAAKRPVNILFIRFTKVGRKAKYSILGKIGEELRPRILSNVTTWYSNLVASIDF